MLARPARSRRTFRAYYLSGENQSSCRSIEVTVDLYGRFIPGADRHHVEALAADIESRKAEQDATPV
jgi:hypothetical protein